MRLIDADVLEPHEQLEPMGNGVYEYVEVVYKDDIDDTPTIDAVEVVRCKDCKHWHEWENGTGMCQRSENSCFWFGVDFDDYCSFGERNEE